MILNLSFFNHEATPLYTCTVPSRVHKFYSRSVSRQVYAPAVFTPKKKYSWYSFRVRPQVRSVAGKIKSNPNVPVGIRIPQPSGMAARVAQPTAPQCATLYEHSGYYTFDLICLKQP
jgi:hypothetical protein